VFQASERELQDVEGIGRKISERIRKIVSTPYREEESTSDS
jgi:ERCC4-type nuclease